MKSNILSINPSNYEILGEIETSSDRDIIYKAHRARFMQKKWKSVIVEKRAGLLKILNEKFIKNKTLISQLVTKEIGMPISQSLGDVDFAVDYLNWYIANASKFLLPEVSYKDDKLTHMVFREPLGVAAVITSWNFPLSNFVWGVAQNLLVGNTVIYKPSEECALFGKYLENMVNNIFPEGVLSIIHGDGKVGDSLIHQDINLISFTGSVKVGKYIYEVAGKKFIKAVCELGGSAPGIVFPDADLDLAVETIYENRFNNCGQICDGLKRLIVHKSIFNNVVDKLKNKLNSIKIGNPEDESTQIGPMVAERQLIFLEKQVNYAKKMGAKTVMGGERLNTFHGAFYKPTILIDIKTGMKVWQEEVFGPVLPIVSFDTLEGAVKMANDTKYGLGAYIFTRDLERANKVAKQIDTGMVSINGASYIQPSSPFGGYKDSGVGREHGRFGFEELTQIKVVAS